MRKLKNLVGRSGQTRCRGRRQLGRHSTCIVIHLHRTLAGEAIRKIIIREIIRRHTGPELREERPEGTLFSEASIITSTLCSSLVQLSVAVVGEGRPWIWECWI